MTKVTFEDVFDGLQIFLQERTLKVNSSTS